MKQLFLKIIYPHQDGKNFFPHFLIIRFPQIFFS